MTIYTRYEYEQVLGKPLPHKHTFVGEATFAAVNAAEQFCKQRGFSVGRMCAGLPIGLKQGDYNIQKWRNLNRADKRRLDGVMVPSTGARFRTGPVEVYFTDEQPEAEEA